MIQINNTVGSPCVGRRQSGHPHRIFTADCLWLRDSSVVAEIFGAEAGPDRAVWVVLSAFQVALLGDVDGVAGRAQEDALGKALSEGTWKIT